MRIVDDDAALGSGSGQINPVKAVHPGLIYNISISSYASFLCKEGYNGTSLALVFGGKKKHNCSEFKPAQGTDGLNYPTMHAQLMGASSDIFATFHRTVTNMGNGNSVYKAKVTSPRGLSIRVSPATLKFSRLHEQMNFKVVVKGSFKRNGTEQLLSALLEWNDSKHSVTNHILIYRPLA